MKVGEDEYYFSVKVVMKKRWVPYFLSFLYELQCNGNLGHSEMVGLYSDGDGDFRPRFAVDDPELDWSHFKDSELCKDPRYAEYVRSSKDCCTHDMTYFDAG